MRKTSIPTHLERKQLPPQVIRDVSILHPLHLLVQIILMQISSMNLEMGTKEITNSVDRRRKHEYTLHQESHNNIALLLKRLWRKPSQLGQGRDVAYGQYRLLVTHLAGY